VLSAKLPHLAAWTARRRAVAADYDRWLAGVPGIERPACAEGREHVYHLYVIRCDERDALARHLAGKGIQTVVNYPVALPFLPAYRRFDHQPEDFPVAHRAQSRVLSLPIFPEITAAQIQAVADEIGSFITRRT
jgi:dTDP-4-amino-4,6-dideoxygalactose transaminase